MYDENAPKLAGMGYFAIPVAPANVSYVAKKSPVVFDPYENRYVNLTDWGTMTIPITAPQPGANIGVRCGGNIVGLDFDNEEAAPKIAAAFEPSPVNKAGETAFTAFYRTDFPVPNENFYDDNGNLVLQILSDGKQTVIPPSVHADTKEPYRWLNGHSLYNTPPSMLPLLPRDYRERILALGYVPQKPKPKVDEKFDPETGEIQNGFGDNPCAELNAAALKNLPAWVPALGLYKCQRQRGRYTSYRAVASWGESATGRPLEERGTNLSICGSGIKDFGDDKTYSPLDLVMAARSSSLAEAFCWLEEKLLPQKPDIEVDFDKIIEAQDAPSIVSEPDTKTDGNAPDNPDDAWVGKEWEDGDPVPAPLPMLIPYFVPLEPYLGYLWGQSQTYKTFLLNTMAVAVASGGFFAGQRVTERGLVYQVELEGSRSQLRIQAAKQFAGITERLPIVHVTKTPPALIGAGKRVSADWKKWATAIVRKARAAAERWGVPLKLITIDPQNHFAGFTDEQSSAEGNVVCNALKGKGVTLFKRTFDSLMAKKKIQGFEDWVWIPLID